MKEGIYEQLITKQIQTKLNELDQSRYYIEDKQLTKDEAAIYLSRYVANILKYALNCIKKDDDSISKHIELANKIIYLLQSELKDDKFQDYLLVKEGRFLTALIDKLDFPYTDIKQRLSEITPYTRLTQSELFTGSNAGVSLDSELKREIESSDEICFLVSFIKFSGIRIFLPELERFAKSGKKIRIISTTYVGATDLKAIAKLAELPNTEIKISYNTKQERLHAKAYLFLRNSGFHTGYIGSSNLSLSALTKGLEWNVKITTAEIDHVIDKFKKTFETYWENPEFELYDPKRDVEKLRKALKAERQPDNDNTNTVYFDINPFHFQTEILEQLEVERNVKGHFRNLIVAATGTGKTMISAFDYKRFRKQNPNNCRLLFVAHRKEILQQALSSYRQVIKDLNFGQLWVDGETPDSFEVVFASVQTLNSQFSNYNLSDNFFDYIVIDEVHHNTASSYQNIIQKFNPKILLGLTATPERMDGGDITVDFDNRIAAEIRLPDAMRQKLLCPFQYFGITDNIDLNDVNWINGRYDVSELTKLYTRNDDRMSQIIPKLEKYLTDEHAVRALGFCVSKEHAEYMAQKFKDARFKADYLHSGTNERRDELKKALTKGDLNYLFVVDIFNEGVDIPEIDTVLFLRPTESLTVFLQQLGRGLRISEGKECLTVLDFVGNARKEYNYEQRFRALIGRTNTSVEEEIKKGFIHLPLGCSIQLEKVAQEHILANIKEQLIKNKRMLIKAVQNFKNNSLLPITLSNFIKFCNVSLERIYIKTSHVDDNGNSNSSYYVCWNRLLKMANITSEPLGNAPYQEVARAINKWLVSESYTYFCFILKLANNKFRINWDALSESEQLMCNMLYYDVWQDSQMHGSLTNAIELLGKDQHLAEEIKTVMELLIDRIQNMEYDLDLGFAHPLKVHASYTREQILAAIGQSTYDNKKQSWEGVFADKTKNIELLMFTLDKSEGNYSPTTMYEDYALSDKLFHWQSQNQTASHSKKGKSYIHHREQQKQILLFVQKEKKDEYGRTPAYQFLGRANYVSHYGEKPMSITWELEQEMPASLWQYSAKMAVE